MFKTTVGIHMSEHRLKRRLLLTTLIVQINKCLQKDKKKRAFRVRNLFLNRKRQGAFDNLLEEMRLGDPDKYTNYLRMTSDQFSHLLQIVGPYLQKDDRFRTDVLSPAERLCLTIR